jgi:hypothetical protein
MLASQGTTTIWTTYRYQVGLIVPLVTLAIGIVGKKIARGAGWERTDFYIGTELSLAGVSGALVNLFDLLKEDRTIGLLERKLLGGNVAIVLLGLLLFYIALSLHQDFGPSTGKSTKKQLFFLLGISNLVGLFTLIGALLLMAP